MTKLVTLVVAGALTLAACGGGNGIIPRALDDTTSTTVAQVTTSTQQAASTTTTTVAQTTTTVVRTTTTASETMTTVVQTTSTAAQSTTTVDASSDCPDCPDSATDEDRAYVASMRLVESWYDRNFVTSMSAVEIMDIGQTVCIGLAGSFNGSLDIALNVVTILYEVKPGSGTGVAVAAIEQAVRVYCPKYTDAWIEWAGTEPYDPFE